MSAPVNDLCANALVVSSLPYTDTQDIVPATDSGDDPVNSTNSGFPARHGIWYQWTAPSNMDVMADLFGSQPFSFISGPSTQGLSVLLTGVFTGSCGGPWTEVAAKRTGNHNYTGKARVQFSAVSGTTYYFHVGTQSSGTIGNTVANLVFRLFATPAVPSNDLCASAVVVNSFPTTDSNRNCYAATVSGDDPVESIEYGDVLQQSVWYKVTSPTNATLTVDSVGSDFQPVLAVFSTGSCGTLGGELDGEQGNISPSFTDTSITWAATGGQDYYVLAGMWNFPSDPLAMGILTLNFTSDAPTPPPDPPTGLTATPIDYHAFVDVSWTAPVSGTPPDTYIVERCAGSGCSGFVQFDETALTSLTDNPFGAPPSPAAYGLTYRYRVKSHSTLGGDSAYTDPVEVTTVIPDPAMAQYGGYMAVMSDLQRATANSQTPLMKVTGPDGLVFDVMADKFSEVQIFQAPDTFNMVFEYGGSGSSHVQQCLTTGTGNSYADGGVTYLENFGAPLQTFEVTFKQESYNIQTSISNGDGELQFYVNGVLRHAVTNLAMGFQPWDYVQVGPNGFMGSIFLSDRPIRCPVYANTYPTPGVVPWRTFPNPSQIVGELAPPVADVCSITDNVIYNQNFLGAANTQVFDADGNYWNRGNPSDPALVNGEVTVGSSIVPNIVTTDARFLYSDIGYISHYPVSPTSLIDTSEDANAGSYAVTGVDATLEFAEAPFSPGTYAITGAPLSLTYQKIKTRVWGLQRFDIKPRSEERS